MPKSAKPPQESPAATFSFGTSPTGKPAQSSAYSEDKSTISKNDYSVSTDGTTVTRNKPKSSKPYKQKGSDPKENTNSSKKSKSSKDIKSKDRDSDKTVKSTKKHKSIDPEPNSKSTKSYGNKCGKGSDGEAAAKSKKKSKSKKSDGKNGKKSSKIEPSADGYMIASKDTSELSSVKEKKKHQRSSKHNTKDSSSANKTHGKKSSSKSCGDATTASAHFGTKKRHNLARKVRAMEETTGAIPILNETSVASANYVVDVKAKLYQSDYSQVFRAHNVKNKTATKMVVKVINLTECSPRQRANLVKNSVRILRYVSGATDESKPNATPLSHLFIKIYDMFIVSGVKLLIFMEECNAARLLYDLVKSPTKISPQNVREWVQAIATGVHALQGAGVAHRAIKLQHIIFDYLSKPKLCGWSKAVCFYEPKKRRILLQKKERRVRHNYHLPPEAFQGSYDPSKADIWAIGVILVAASTKRYPFKVRDNKVKFSSQWREFVKKNELNHHLRSLCNKIFIISPRIRISSGDILEDAYFSVDDARLDLLSIKADPTLVHEDSRVGAVSTIDDTDISPAAGKKKTDKSAATPMDPNAEAEAEGLEDNATGMEGGNVGEEDNLPPEEQQDESQMAENVAPEEGETEAQPEDGEQQEWDGTEGAAEDGESAAEQTE